MRSTTGTDTAPVSKPDGDARPAEDAGGGIAARLATAAHRLLGRPLPIRLRAWDGSEAGPPGPPVLVLRHRRTLRRLIWQPGELGLADAYVSGDLDVDGELGLALERARTALPAGHSGRRFPVTGVLGAVVLAFRLRALGPRPPVPAPRVRVTGRTHSRGRDRAVVSHHYDQSNDLYRLLLDESMAYSCAYWAGEGQGYGLPEAQRDKLELVSRKLALRPGQRLLDLGCGWGSLAIYAAEHHQVRVTAVTLSGEQSRYIAERVRARDLGDLVDVRLCDYRDVGSAEPYDAVASIEMGEHVGRDGYPDLARLLHRLVRPGGRLLVQQMSRGSGAPGGGPFIEAYIAPDMHMQPLGETVGLLEAAGFEVQATESLREHYARTVAAWRDTLEARWDDVVALVGLEVARVWRLYLAGGVYAFAQGRTGVDQILAVRPGVAGTPGTFGDTVETPAAWYEGLAVR